MVVISSCRMRGSALVAEEPLLEDRLVVDVQRQAGFVEGARSLEAAGLDLEQVVAAVAVGVDPFADRVAREGRRESRRPVAAVGVDAAEVVVPADQHVGGLRRDDEFQRAERHHHVGHAGRAAERGREIAEPALGLIGEALLQDGLIFRRQRRLLPEAPRLGLVVRRLAAKPAHGEPLPLAGPIRIFARVGILRRSKRRQQGRGERRRSARVTVRRA